MAKDKLVDAPRTVSPAQLVAASTDDGFNDVVLRDAQRQEFPAAEMPYSCTTDEGLASRRSKHVVRTHDEVKAACNGDLPIGQGLSLRAPMAGQCGNDQFPFQTDRFGKQRS
jgi:hypothetical protein